MHQWCETHHILDKNPPILINHREIIFSNLTLIKMKNKLLYAFTAILLFLMPNLNFGQAIAPDLKTSSRFALFTAAGQFENTGLSTKVTGDVGNNTGAFLAFPPGTLMGLKFRGSVLAEAPVTAQAALDVASAFAEITLKNTCDAGHSTLTPTLGVPFPNPPQVLTPNFYCIGSAATLNGELVLDGGGDPNAVFVFRIGGAFATAVDSKITLRNGASACNVYWQINGAVSLAGSSSVATPTPFQGTILANGAIALLVNAQLIGRGLSTTGAISLADNVVVTAGMPPTASTITAGGAITFCAGGSVTLSGNVGGTWSNGGATALNSFIVVTTSGDYFVTNTNGCQTVTSNHIIVTVTPLPAANAGNSVSICSGASVMIGAPAVAGSTYSWTASTGPVPVGANPTVSPIVTTTYTLTETITATGCQKMNSVTITVGAAPTCAITGSDICGAGTTQLCVITASPVSYLWTGPGIVGSNTGQCITVNAGGLYSVAVMTSCGTSNCSKMVSVNPLPAATTGGPFNICAGGSVRIGAPAVAGSTYSWIASVGPVPVGPNPLVSPTVTTTYTLTETNTTTGCQRMNMVTVNVNPAPICSITGNSSICPGATTLLTALPASTLANPLTYLWSTTQTTQSITVGAGSYSVVVTNATGCSSVCAILITVEPFAIAGVNATICNGSSVTLGSVPIAGHTYSWSPATGLSSTTIANPVASPSVTTTYTLIETITATGCQNSNPVTVVVNPSPNCTITGNPVICQGQSTQLCVPPVLTSTYLWSTSATSDCIIVNTAGPYSVTVTNAASCRSICSQAVTVNPLPIASIITANGATTFCAGGSVTLTQSGSGTWSNGAGAVPSITVMTSGDYFVTTTNSCGSIISNHIMVTVNPLPICAITGNGIICQGLTTQLCASPGASTYLWSTGANTSCITVSASGIYFVTLTNASRCSSVCSMAATVTNIPPPTPSIIKADITTSCEGDGSAVLSGNNNGGIWSTGETTPSITVTTSGDYYVINTNGCSIISNHIIVTFNPRPPPIIDYAVICNGISVMIGNYPIVGHTYLWTPSTGLSSTTIANPIASPVGKIIYTLIETITATGCQRTSYVTVDPHPPCDCTCR
jgi:hypothetical protein